MGGASSILNLRRSTRKAEQFWENCRRAASDGNASKFCDQRPWSHRRFARLQSVPASAILYRSFKRNPQLIGVANMCENAQFSFGMAGSNHHMTYIGMHPRCGTAMLETSMIVKVGPSEGGVRSVSIYNELPHFMCQCHAALMSPGSNARGICYIDAAPPGSLFGFGRAIQLALCSHVTTCSSAQAFNRVRDPKL